MPNALLLGYDLNQPSFRHRMQSLVAPLTAAGWDVRTEGLPGGRYGLRTWERRTLLRWADVTVLHQIKLSAVEARLFAAFASRRVFDFDDAIYVRKPRRLGEAAGDSVWRRRKFAATCRFANLVAAGNEVLAGAARESARAIAILPTAIDTTCYRPSTAQPADPPTIVWIGSPENLIYLELVRPALRRLSVRHAQLRLKIICSQFPDWPEIRIERAAWSSATEAEELASAHIGIMPLTDDAWSRGKCAFKLLQYMAASLPCVASPVGANAEAVLDGQSGFHARDENQWFSTLDALLADPALRAHMGARGRAHAEERYAMRRYRQRYVELLTELVMLRV
jgi:glycosyltransferase involved in cell wall biosynthesis